jgi:hypothetical protein
VDEMTEIDDEYDPGTLEEDQPEPRPVGIQSWLAPVGIAVLVVSLVVVALLRDQTSFDPTTPEGAVQEYLNAVKEHRWEDAAATLDPEVYADCDIGSIVEPFEPFTAIHQRTYESGGRTHVEVIIREQRGGLFGGSYDHHTTFSLVRVDRHWYISEAPWPWFLWQCARFG